MVDHREERKKKRSPERERDQGSTDERMSEVRAVAEREDKMGRKGRTGEARKTRQRPFLGCAACAGAGALVEATATTGESSFINAMSESLSSRSSSSAPSYNDVSRNEPLSPVTCDAQSASNAGRSLTGWMCVCVWPSFFSVCVTR